MKNVEFSADHIDVLRELMNIAMGSATASIADLLHAFGTMHIPKIIMSDLNGLREYIAEQIGVNERYFVTKQLFGGTFGGEFIFMITEASAGNLGNYLYEVDSPSEADIYDAVVELTNILSSAIISSLMNELDTKVQFFAPFTQVMPGCELVKMDASDEYSQIIIISTQMEFEQQQINGSICILTKDEMIEELKSLIDRKLEELFS